MAPTANTSIWASSNHMLVAANARASTTVVMIAANLGPLTSMSMVELLAADKFLSVRAGGRLVTPGWALVAGSDIQLPCCPGGNQRWVRPRVSGSTLGGGHPA